MKVFIGNLPGEATIYELENFLGGLKIHSGVKHCSGYDIDQYNYHYFIINAEDVSTKNSLIERFNGQYFHGRIVEARGYITCWQVPIGYDQECRVNAY
jgi:hypothetical protein